MPVYLTDEHDVLSGPFEFPVVPGIGVQLPSNAVTLPEILGEPDQGKAWAFVEGVAVQMIDARGYAYRTSDGAMGIWHRLGPLPDEYTDQPRPACHTWDGARWVPDRSLLMSAAAEERDRLLKASAGPYSILQDAVDIGRATDQDLRLLTAWKSFRVDLMRVEQQEGYPYTIKWPEEPKKEFHEQR